MHIKEKSIASKLQESEQKNLDLQSKVTITELDSKQKKTTHAE